MDDGLTVDLIHANPDGAFNTIRGLEAEVEQLRAQCSVSVTKLAAILRLTYDEDMPERLADLIRPLCAHPADHPDVRRSVAQTPSSDITALTPEGEQ